MTKLLNEVSSKLFDYLGLEEIEIKYEEMGEDSRFYNHELYIGINNKYINDEYESLKCIIHSIPKNSVATTIVRCLCVFVRI